MIIQVPAPVGKSMNNVHSIFDSSAEEGKNISAGEIEARKWRYVMLDFSKVKGVGELSSKAVYADDGEKDSLDYDYIEVPMFFDETKKEISHHKIFLGFKVGVHSPEGEGGRKVQRTGVKKSKLQLKKEEAKRRREAEQAKAKQQRGGAMGMNLG